MRKSKRPARPAFTGLVAHRDVEYRYSLLYPEGWHRHELESDGGQGVILSPSPDSIATSFSVEARDLGTEVTGDDLPALRDGVLDGLRRLPELTIERQEDFAVGALTGLEVWHTFREEGAVRKRWLRLLYQGSLQVRLIAQGASIAEYEYWLPMLNQVMRSFQFADWWAEMTGVSWLPSLEKEPETDE